MNIRKIMALTLACLLCLAGCAQEAALRFSSFEGGGPEYRVEVADPTVVTFESSRAWDGDGEPVAPGAGYTQTYVFTGLKPGETTGTVHAESPRVEELDAVYTAVVDEALNVTLSCDRRLVRFEFTRGGYIVPQSWTILMLQGDYYLMENDGEPWPLEDGVVAEIEGILDAANVTDWNGFNGADPYVLDGESFSLYIAYSDGAFVSASGENAFPEGYGAMDRIIQVLDGQRVERLSGSYRYEGEGFGGDFTLTLNADGTFTYSEGPLSSYLGMGEWYADIYGVTLSEMEDDEVLRRFLFTVDGDALVCYGPGSDEFDHVRVPDGGRFVREE